MSLPDDQRRLERHDERPDGPPAGPPAGSPAAEPDTARDRELALPPELREIEASLRRVEERASSQLDQRVAALFTAASAASRATRTAGAVVRSPAAAGRLVAERPVRSLLRDRRLAAAAAVVVIGGLAFALGRFAGWIAPDAPELVPASTASGDRASPSDSTAVPAMASAPPAERQSAPGEASRADVPVADVMPSLAAEDDDCDPPEPTEWHSGFPMNVNAALTFERAPIVARLRTVGTHLVPCVHGGEHTILRPLAEVRHVYKGDATLVGRWIELHRCIGESARSFLAWGDGYPPTPGGEWVATFALIDLPAFPDTTLHAQQLLAEGYGGTMLTDRRPLASGAPRADRAAALTELLHDLAASLADPLTAVSAATALRQFDAGPSPMTPPDSAVWRDPVAAVELLSATRRDPPRLRWTIAWMNPARAGPEGEQRLLALAFDSDPLVRQPALHWLSRPEEAGLAADGPVALAARELAGLATARADSPFDELLTEALEQGGELFDDESLTHHLKRLKAERDPDARRRALLAMRSVQRGDAVEALLAGLDDADAAVRRAAAFVLSTSGFEHSGAVQARLHDVPDHEDETVQALAGYAELLHGSVYGLDRLKRLLESGSPAAGERAVELLARAGARPMDRGDEPLRGDGGVGIAGMLVRAAGHDDVVVRSRALIALARIAPRQFQMGASESSFEEVIASAEADSSALVRQAALLARAALRRDEEMSGEGAGALKSVPYDLGYGGR